MLGNASLPLGEKEAAREYYHKSLELRQALAADPGSARPQIDLATSLIRLGDVSEPEAAQKYYQEASKIRKKLVDAEPRPRSELVRELWVAYNRLGDVSLRLSDPKAARQHYSEGGKLALALVNAAPTSFQFKLDLASSLEKMGTVCRQLGQDEAARKYYDQALSLLRPLAAKDPQNLLVQEGLALALARAGRHTEAAAQAEQLAQLAPEMAANLYNVACCYARCVDGVAQDKQDTALSLEELALQRRYVSLAVGALQKAVDLGFGDASLLETDPDLESIRRQPGYTAILQKLK
jgi:tetratricopeptide (TPR) repeat protein